MLLKKPGIVACSTSPALTLSLGTRFSRPLSSSSSSLSPSAAAPPSIGQQQQQYRHHRSCCQHVRASRRGYATVQGDNDGIDGSSNDGSRRRHGDVPSWPRTPNPTPYEIMDFKKGAPYSKARFYQLVKLYHPDTHEHQQSNTHQPPHSHSHDSHDRIPSAVRLERYRLVVAANGLLSDPAKRKLYDNRGIGWTGGRTPSPNEAARHADRTWRQQPHNAANNATWEDWERWHEERDGRSPKEPVHMPNGVFAMLVVMMCMVGAMAQKTRAENSGSQYVDIVSQKNAHLGSEMRKSTAAMAGHSKDQRIETFVRDRENVTWDFAPKRYDDGSPDGEREENRAQ
jgi:hypothetical protein